jgi:hypothetical protein
MTFACGVGDGLSFLTVGWLPVALFGIAVCCFLRRSLPWVIMLALFGWLAVAENAPVNLFGLLAGLPVFNAIAMPYKYFCFPILLSIALGAGQVFWLLPKLRGRWREHACAVLLIAGGVGYLYAKATLVQRHTYVFEIPDWARVREQEFFNVSGLGLPRNRVLPSHSLTYLNTLRNVGTIDWYTAMPLDENAIPKYFVDADNRSVPNPAYRGEAFFAHEGGSVEEVAFHPNRIAVRVRLQTPGVLVINQNYHPAWRADQGELFEWEGLLAVRLRETGPHVVQLRYLPQSFVVGLAVSLLGTTGWALACLTFVGKRLHRWSEGGQQTLARGGRRD